MSKQLTLNWILHMETIAAVGIVLGVLGCGDLKDSNPPLSGAVEDEVGRFLDSYRLAIEARDAPFTSDHVRR